MTIPRMTYILRSESRTGGDAVRISLPLVPLLLDLPKYSLPADAASPASTKEADMNNEERKKLALLRRADSTAATKYSVGGLEKTHRAKRKPVTLPDPEKVKAILDREG